MEFKMFKKIAVLLFSISLFLLFGCQPDGSKNTNSTNYPSNNSTIYSSNNPSNNSTVSSLAQSSNQFFPSTH
jgi:ABC-type oligopeptide transport system substrate-binding subunit